MGSDLFMVFSITLAPAKPPSTAEKHFDQGLAYLDGERYDEAITEFTKAIELDPYCAVAYTNRGIAYCQKGIFDQAIANFNKVIELDRSYEEGGADRVLGRVFFKVPGIAGGDKDESLRHLLKSIEFAPNSPRTLLYLGETYLALKEIDKAREALDKVLATPDDGLWINSIKQLHADAKVVLENRKFKK